MANVYKIDVLKDVNAIWNVALLEISIKLTIESVTMWRFAVNMEVKLQFL